MSLKSSFCFDFGNLNENYYKLLTEEDFDFKNKDIKLSINLTNSLDVELDVGSVLDLKIATSALIKSLEIIDKTLNI